MIKRLGVLLLCLWIFACGQKPAVFGPCRFEVAAMSFAGSALDQARCLLRPVETWARLGPTRDRLPAVLEASIDRPLPLSQAAFRAYLVREGLTEKDVGGALAGRLSRSHGDAAWGAPARYFVLHDTSAPYLGDAPFPEGLDESRGVNRLDRYRRGAAVAHVFVSRRGEVYLGHDFGVPWRATKLELDRGVGAAAKGLFLHVELVQPRRRHPAGGPRNDALAPEPGFSRLQYRRAAELYVAASLRAGRGLIPAFHAVLDSGFEDGHDDPQNFDLAAWAAEIEAVLREAGSSALKGRGPGGGPYSAARLRLRPGSSPRIT